MYGEVENATNCVVPCLHGSIMFSYPRVGPNDRQSLKGDMAFLDLLS